MRTVLARNFLAAIGLALVVQPCAPVMAEGIGRGDPLQIVVSIDEQRMRVFRGEEEIANSPISSGKPGNDTPTGIFSILHKSKFHRSNQYSNSPMPWMQRLTWTGIALHESDDVPDRPASHGCVRMPGEFAKGLFDMTGVGEHVIINTQPIAPFPINHPALPQPVARIADATDLWLAAYLAGGDGAADERRKPLRMLITRRPQRERIADIQAMLMQAGYYSGLLDGGAGRQTREAIARFRNDKAIAPANGEIDDALVAALQAATGAPAPKSGVLQVRLGFAPLFETRIDIADDRRPLGVHVFTTSRFDEEAGYTDWLALTLDNELSPVTRGIFGIDERQHANAHETIGRLGIDPATRARIAELLAPGSSIVIADAGHEKYTGWRTDFVVVTRAPRLAPL